MLFTFYTEKEKRKRKTGTTLKDLSMPVLFVISESSS